MTNTSITYLVAAFSGVCGLAAYIAFVLVPAWTAYRTRSHACSKSEPITSPEPAEHTVGATDSIAPGGPPRDSAQRSRARLHSRLGKPYR